MSLVEGRESRKAPEGFRVTLGDDGIAVLTIDRAAKRNALTLSMWESLPEILGGLSGTPGLRVLLVTGDGTTFSAGADITELQEIYGDLGHARAYHAMNVAAETALAAFAYPTIAVIHGSCVGGGCQLAVACDLRIAADTAQFGVTPAKLGVVYPAEPTTRLERLIGPARAKYLLFSADLIDAAKAYEFGLVDEVVAEAGLDERALALATTIAGRSPQSVGAAKAVIDAIGTGRDTSMAVAAWQHSQDDVREGLAAFVANRPPQFNDPR